MEVWIICTCFGLFTMSIILGIVIVYIIDKKLSNIVIKIPKLEPVIINNTDSLKKNKLNKKGIKNNKNQVNDIKFWDEVPLQGRLLNVEKKVTLNNIKNNSY